MLTVQDFEKFLRDNDIYDKYQDNYQGRTPILRREHNLSVLPSSCVGFLAAVKATPNLFMTKCFVWQKTKEGHKFWSGWNKKWLLLVYPPKKSKKDE